MIRTAPTTKTLSAVLLLATAFGSAARGAEYHVALGGNDANPGTRAAPFRTIQRGANAAMPGDVVTVHEGIYRERVDPPRGGTSESQRIVYQAAPGETVEIRGSEIVHGWVRARNDAWKVTLPNAFFGSFNPYNDVLHGEWFKDLGRQIHTGAVYLNGEWLIEAAALDEVLRPAGPSALWFSQVTADGTTIWAQFRSVDPNAQLVEINARQSVFYPSKAGNDYITVRGFGLRHAATPWAGAQSEQIGLIGTHWSKGWIVENNTISHSLCTGVTLGLRDLGHTWEASAKGYVETVRTAIDQGGWLREKVGSHVVRNNHISHCEKAGIHGSLGGAFSVITGNVIHDIHVHDLFAGADMAGIKLLGGIDVTISHNHIYHTVRGIWLDWMAQGARVSCNLLHDNRGQDLFVEVNHGPFLVDNNLFLSPLSIQSWSHGGAYVHNLIAGEVLPKSAGRVTPFHKPHSTDIAGLHTVPCGDDRFYNNLLVAHADLSPYDNATLPVWMAGNVFIGEAQPSKHEANSLVAREFDPTISLSRDPKGLFLEMAYDVSWVAERVRPLVTTELLGRAAVPDAAFEHPNGRPLRIDSDYFGNRRDLSNPAPGPFEHWQEGKLKVKVW